MVNYRYELVETYRGVPIWLSDNGVWYTVYSADLAKVGLSYPRDSHKSSLERARTHIDDLYASQKPTPPAEFRFDSYNPPLDMSELFSTKASAKYDVGESVYVHYAVKNVGTVPGAGTMEVRDLDTGALITTYNVPELPINGRFKTTGSGAYVGKMPSNDWRLEFKVTP